MRRYRMVGEVSNKTIVEMAQVISKFCATRVCNECPLADAKGECTLQDTAPECWEPVRDMNIALHDVYTELSNEEG
jgi:hypothetical protein